MREVHLDWGGTAGWGGHRGYFLGVQVPPPILTPLPSIFDPPPVYFRALVNFTRSIDYSQRLEDPESEEFREISEAVVDTVRGGA